MSLIFFIISFHSFFIRFRILDEIKKQLLLSNAKVLFGVAERERELRNVCDNLKISVIAIKTNVSKEKYGFSTYII